MPFIDFADVKSRVSIEDAAEKLGLVLKPSAGKLRCPCPIHGGGDRAIVITPEKGLFCCFGSRPSSGGDQIQLVAHVKEIPVKDAAEFLGGTVPLAQNKTTPPNNTKPSIPTAPPGRKPGFDVVAYAAKLDPGAPALLPLPSDWQRTTAPDNSERDKPAGDYLRRRTR